MNELEEQRNKVGFGVDRTFRRQFNKKYNMSPKDYRRFWEEKR